MEATASKRDNAMINIVEVNADSSINQKKQVTFNKKRESSEEETETISAQPLVNNGVSNNHSYTLKEIGTLEEVYSPFQVDHIDAHFEGDLAAKKKMRKAQMKRRLDCMLDQQQASLSSSKARNDIILASSPKIDIRNLTKDVKSASGEDSQGSHRNDDANNSSQQSHEFLSDCVSQNEQVLQQSAVKTQNMTASKINETDHLEKPVASILKQPTGISNKDKDEDGSFQKQRSMKFRKQVSISEEPRVLPQAERQQAALVNGQQSDGTMFSVSSFENDNKHPSKERPSVTEQFQEDKHSIISEEDSAFEEQTPKDGHKYGPGKMFGGMRRSQDQDFSSSIKRRPDKLSVQRKKTNPQKIVKTNQTSSEMIIVVDDRKQKVKRIQTMENEQQKQKSKFHKNIQGSPSFTRVGEQDRNSLNSKCNSHSQKRDAEKSGHLKMENLQVPTMYRKQATQDHRDRGGRQRKFVSPEEQVLTTGRKSRNTSLNLTVDNQLDHLSVNFGRRQDNTANIANGSVLSAKSRQSSNKKGKFVAKRGRQIDQILATSKHNIPPHSTDKFVKKNYIRASHQSQVRQSIRSRASMDDQKSISQDFSSTNGARRATNEGMSVKDTTSPACERPGLDINARLNKANKKMIQIYMKTPYKVQFYNPIMRANQSKSPQTQRLYQAENQLKISKNIHLMSRPKKSHIKHQDQKEQKTLLNTQRRGTLGSNKNLSPETLRYHRQYTSTSKQNKEKDYIDLARGRNPRKASAHKLTQNAVEPQSSASVFSNVQNVGYSLNGSNAGLDKNYKKSLSFTEKTKTDKSTQDQAFRIKFYDQLIHHIDKRLQNCQGQLTQIKKQRDICDIYGQTLQSINFGDTPYTSVNYGFHKQSTFSSGIRKTNLVDADKLKSVVGDQKLRTTSRFSTRNEVSKNLTVQNLEIKNPKELSIVEGQQEIVIQEPKESARTQKNSRLDRNPMDSEQVSVAEAQEESLPRNMGEHMIQPVSEIEALESMQQAYLMQQRSQEDEFDQTSYQFTNSQGNLSEQYDLLRQIVTMSSKMGFSHQQMHYLKEKHQALEDLENQLEHQYKNKRFRISPAKKVKRGKKITISNLETKKRGSQRNELVDSKLDEVRTPVLLYYPEPASQKKIKTEKKGRNLSQFNKRVYQDKIKEHMGSSKNNLAMSSKKPALDEVNSNHVKTQSEIKSNYMVDKRESELRSMGHEKNENSVDPSSDLLSAHQSIQKKLQQDSRQFKKKLNDNQLSINNKIQKEIAELRQRQKEKIDIQLSASKFKRNKGGFSLSKNQGEDLQMITHKNVGDLQSYHSGNKQPKASRTNFIKQNIRNLAPLTNTFYPLQQSTTDQLTPKNSTGSTRHPELWGKKQQLAPIEKDWDKAQSQKFNNTQKVQAYQEEVSPVILKNKNSTSSHYYPGSFHDSQKNKNSRLIHSGQQIIGKHSKTYNNFANNNKKHQAPVSQSHNHKYDGAMRISESNRQLVNKYSPRLPQLESDPAQLQRKIKQIRNNNALEQKEIQATPPPITKTSRSVYQQINQNSLKQQTQYGRSNINQYKQTEVLKNVIKNQRNLSSNRVKTNANSINRSYYPAINQGFNLSNLADKSIAAQQEVPLLAASEVVPGHNLRLVSNQSDINQSGSMQFRQESQDANQPQYLTLDAHGLPSARNSNNNQSSIPNGFVETSSQLRAASKLNAPAQ